jgi:hypothetical protein
VTEPTRHLLACAAAWLDQGRTVDRLSRPLTAAALIGLVVYPVIAGQQSWVVVGVAMVVALSGLLEAYFALRVGFDAALFHQLASAPEAPNFAGTDAALERLGLLSAAKLDRPPEARIAGARRLFRLQILVLVVQVLSVFSGACLALTWR